MLRSQGQRLLRVRGALVGLVVVSGLSVTSSALGFAFQVVLAAHFGVGAAVDSYLFAISVPMFFAGLGAAALSYTVVPMLVLAEDDPAARALILLRLRWPIAGVATLFAMVGLPAVALQPWLLPHAAGAKQITALSTMILIGWSIAGVQIFTALFTIELNAARRPITAALLSLPPNIAAIIVVFLASSSILAAPLGVLLGSVVAAVVGIALTWRAFRPGYESPSIVVSNGIGLSKIAWTLLAMSCFSAYGIIDAFWGPRVGDGILASLGYAQRLVIGIGGLILAGPSAILTPRFAARLRSGGGAELLREVTRTLLFVAVLAAGVAVALALSTRSFIGIAFARGAFDALAVDRVSTIFLAMLPGFWAMLLSVILTRAIYCLAGVEKTMALVGLGWSAVYFVACGALLRLGGTGFGIAYSLAWLSYMIVAMIVLRRYAARASQAGDPASIS